jgi:FKBP-type peptidyl-prolyl cis-trans isomerase SlyD
MDKPQNRFLSVTYQLYTVSNGEKTLEEQTGTEQPFEFITGYGIALDAFEKNLIGLEKDAEFDFTLQPTEAFGDYIPEGMHKLGRDIFTINGKFDNEHIFPGAVITMNDTEDHQFMARVVKIEDDGVTIDTNHPLAGKALNFTGQVIENREATEEEINKLIKMLTGGCGGCGGCGNHNGNCGDGCGDGCGGCK